MCVAVRACTSRDPLGFPRLRLRAILLKLYSSGLGQLARLAELTHLLILTDFAWLYTSARRRPRQLKTNKSNKSNFAAAAPYARVTRDMCSVQQACLDAERETNEYAATTFLLSRLGQSEPRSQPKREKACVEVCAETANMLSRVCMDSLCNRCFFFFFFKKKLLLELFCSF